MLISLCEAQFLKMALSDFFYALYDMMAAVLSIIHTVFEIIIIYSTYQSNIQHPNKKIILNISAIHICFVHVCYAIFAIFWFWSDQKFNNKYLQKFKFVINFFILLSISPFIPIIFYVTTKYNESLLSKFINQHCSFLFKAKSFSREDILNQKLNLYVEWQVLNLVYHAMFLSQFVLQTFPQCVIQLFLLSHNYNNPLFVHCVFISIILCIIQLILKPLPICGFSGYSMSIYFILFDLSCILTDFLMFFITILSLSVSWVIYDIFYFKIMYIIPCFIIWFIFGIMDDFIRLQLLPNFNYTNWKKYLVVFIFILLILIPICIIFPLLALILELGCFIWVALLFFATFRLRLIFMQGHEFGINLWNIFVQFVNQNISKNDKILRLCIINHILIEANKNNNIEIYSMDDQNTDDLIVDSQRYSTFFDERHCELYHDVTMSSFHDHTNFGKNCNVWKYIKNNIYLHPLHYYQNKVSVAWRNYRSSNAVITTFIEYIKWSWTYNQSVIYWLLFVYIVGPYYFISRLLNVIVIIYILTYISFKSMEIKFILILFCVSFCGVIIFGLLSIKRSYGVEWNILPGTKMGYAITELSEENNKEMIKNMLRDYKESVDIPIREKIICDKFGINVGGIIVEYIARFQYLISETHHQLIDTNCTSPTYESALE